MLTGRRTAFGEETAPARHVAHVSCSTCGKRVSNDVIVADVDAVLDYDLVIRAYVECPECIERAAEGRRFLTVEEVAEPLRVSKMTVYRLIERGDLPAVMVGNSRRIRKSALDDYLEAGGSR